MSKNLWLISAAIVIVLISITLIFLLILLPQEDVTQGVERKEYDKISKEEYIYTPTKGITEEAMIEEYTVNSETVREGKSGKNYSPGNVDPFTAKTSGTPGETTTPNPNPPGTPPPTDVEDK